MTAVHRMLAAIEYTCQLLDVVDQFTDEVTATLITDVIYGKVTISGAADAETRQRAAVEAARETLGMFPFVPVPPRVGDGP
jgi:hypothetical protein